MTFRERVTRLNIKPGSLMRSENSPQFVGVRNINYAEGIIEMDDGGFYMLRQPLSAYTVCAPSTLLRKLYA